MVKEYQKRINDIKQICFTKCGDVITESDYRKVFGYKSSTHIKDTMPFRKRWIKIDGDNFIIKKPYTTRFKDTFKM